MCGFFSGIPAVVLGLRARKEAERSGGRVGGEGLALAGIITGAIGSVLSALAVAFVVFLAVLGSQASSDWDEINSDPSNGVCDESRWLQDPDCG